MANEQTADLIIRAWIEQHPSSPFRATVRATTDAADGFKGTVSFADAEAVMKFVRGWLGEVEANADTP